MDSELGVTGLTNIGRGGTATVYSAVDPRWGPVAVKVLNLSGQNTLRRFQREVKALEALKHVRGVVPVLRSGVTPTGEPYLVMPLMSGSLQGVIDDGPMPWLTAVRAMAEVSETVAEAHRQGIVHADLKPDNVLLTDEGHLYVSDFGISKLTDSSLSNSTRFSWTPAYAAPELYSAEVPEHTARSDIYALGATLVGLIIGRPPFTTDGAPDSLMSLMNRILNNGPPDLSPYVGSDALHHVVSTSMAKEPSDRFETAANLGFELRRVLLEADGIDDQPLTVQRPRAMANPADGPDGRSPQEAPTPEADTSSGRPWRRIALAAAAVALCAAAVAAWAFTLGPLGDESDAVAAGLGSEALTTTTTSATSTSAATTAAGETEIAVAPTDDLGEIMGAAPAGAVLTLEAGQFVLDEVATVDRDLTVIGAGDDQTRIVGQNDGGVLRVERATLSLKNLALELSTEFVGVDVVHATDAALRLDAVTVTNGSGHGLSARGQTTAEIVGSRFIDNGDSGVVAFNESVVHVTNSSATGNVVGFLWTGDSRGTATDSRADGNTRDGFVVTGSAAADLVDNVAEANAKAGFAWLEAGGGTATGNAADGNHNGFAVLDSAAPTIERSQATNNNGAGFAWHGDAGGLARDNLSSGSEIDGFAVYGSAAPQLTDNVATDNVKAGFAWLEDSGGVASGNRAEGNRTDGFVTLGSAAPDLTGNEASRNEQAGFRVGQASTPTLSANTASQNSGGPLTVEPEAAPIMDDGELS